MAAWRAWILGLFVNAFARFLSVNAESQNLSIPAVTGIGIRS